MATIKFLDPRGHIDPRDRAPAPGLDRLENRIVGIIDNGQANSTPMLRVLADLLKKKFCAKEVIFQTKPTHMQGAPRQLLDEMLGRCDAIITGLGA